MQVPQLRRLAYICLGVAPVTYMIASGMPFPVWGDALLYLWREYGLGAFAFEMAALIGALGLWSATAAALPPSNRWVSRLISVALIIGMCAMVPWTVLLVFLSVANVIQHHTFVDLSTISGIVEYLGNTAFIGWCFVGPVSVSIHYLWRASNKRFERSRRLESSVSEGGSR
jgi:hypothetical protein